jgi:hypothetical protein
MIRGSVDKAGLYVTTMTVASKSRKTAKLLHGRVPLGRSTAGWIRIIITNIAKKIASRIWI